MLENIGNFARHGPFKETFFNECLKFSLCRQPRTVIFSWRSRTLEVLVGGFCGSSTKLGTSYFTFSKNMSRHDGMCNFVISGWVKSYQMRDPGPKSDTVVVFGLTCGNLGVLEVKSLGKYWNEWFSNFSNLVHKWKYYYWLYSHSILQLNGL